MDSAPSNYSECKFSAKSNNFKKITILGGFLTFLGSKMPPGGELEFSRHIHYDFLNLGLGGLCKKQKRHFSCFIVIQLCAKIRKIQCAVFQKKCYGRTDGWTDGGELIGPISASGRGPKNEFSTVKILSVQTFSKSKNF